MLCETLATGVSTSVFQWRRPGLPPKSFRTAYALAMKESKALVRMCWHQSEGNFPLVSSSTFGSSRHRSGRGSCADRPRNQTGSHRSTARKEPRQLAASVCIRLTWPWLTNMLRQEEKKKKAVGQATYIYILSGTPYLFSLWDPAAGNDNDLVFLVERYDLGDAVGSAWVVHVAGKRESGRLRRHCESPGVRVRRHSPSWSTGQRCVNHLLVVDAEHVDPSVLEEAPEQVSAHLNIHKVSLSSACTIFSCVPKIFQFCII